jgi:hypothetical protein
MAPLSCLGAQWPWSSCSSTPDPTTRTGEAASWNSVIRVPTMGMRPVSTGSRTGVFLYTPEATFLKASTDVGEVGRVAQVRPSPRTRRSPYNRPPFSRKTTLGTNHLGRWVDSTSC